jgi:hypothetical protein
LPSAASNGSSPGSARTKPAALFGQRSSRSSNSSGMMRWSNATTATPASTLCSATPTGGGGTESAGKATLDTHGASDLLNLVLRGRSRTAAPTSSVPGARPTLKGSNGQVRVESHDPPRRFVDTRVYYSTPGLDPRWDLGRTAHRPERRSQAHHQADTVLDRVAEGLRRRLSSSSAPSSPFPRSASPTAPRSLQGGGDGAPSAKKPTTPRAVGGRERGAQRTTPAARNATTATTNDNTSPTSLRHERSVPRRAVVTATPVQAATSSGGSGGACPISAPELASTLNQIMRTNGRPIHIQAQHAQHPVLHASTSAPSRNSTNRGISLPPEFKLAAAQEVLRRAREVRAQRSQSGSPRREEWRPGRSSGEDEAIPIGEDVVDPVLVA